MSAPRTTKAQRPIVTRRIERAIRRVQNAGRLPMESVYGATEGSSLDVQIKDWTKYIDDNKHKHPADFAYAVMELLSAIQAADRRLA